VGPKDTFPHLPLAVAARVDGIIAGQLWGNPFRKRSRQEVAVDVDESESYVASRRHEITQRMTNQEMCPGFLRIENQRCRALVSDAMPTLNGTLQCPVCRMRHAGSAGVENSFTDQTRVGAGHVAFRIEINTAITSEPVKINEPSVSKTDNLQVLHGKRRNVVPPFVPVGQAGASDVQLQQPRAKLVERASARKHTLVDGLTVAKRTFGYEAIKYLRLLVSKTNRVYARSTKPTLVGTPISASVLNAATVRLREFAHKFGRGKVQRLDLAILFSVVLAQWSHGIGDCPDMLVSAMDLKFDQDKGKRGGQRTWKFFKENYRLDHPLDLHAFRLVKLSQEAPAHWSRVSARPVSELAAAALVQHAQSGEPVGGANGVQNPAVRQSINPSRMEAMVRSCADLLVEQLWPGPLSVSLKLALRQVMCMATSPDQSISPDLLLFFEAVYVNDRTKAFKQAQAARKKLNQNLLKTPHELHTTLQMASPAERVKREALQRMAANAKFDYYFKSQNLLADHRRVADLALLCLVWVFKCGLAPLAIYETIGTTTELEIFMYKSNLPYFGNKRSMSFYSIKKEEKMLFSDFPIIRRRMRGVRMQISSFMKRKSANQNQTVAHALVTARAVDNIILLPSAQIKVACKAEFKDRFPASWGCTPIKMTLLTRKVKVLRTRDSLASKAAAKAAASALKLFDTSVPVQTSKAGGSAIPRHVSAATTPLDRRASVRVLHDDEHACQVKSGRSSLLVTQAASGAAGGSTPSFSQPASRKRRSGALEGRFIKVEQLSRVNTEKQATRFIKVEHLRRLYTDGRNSDDSRPSGLFQLNHNNKRVALGVYSIKKEEKL
jgi:hypothetical protein